MPSLPGFLAPTGAVCQAQKQHDLQKHQVRNRTVLLATREEMSKVPFWGRVGIHDTFVLVSRHHTIEMMHFVQWFSPALVVCEAS